MLQHSGSSSSQKELTDMNVLSDKYPRLSYHGLRAREKSFNAMMETDFDERLKEVNMVPQDKRIRDNGMGIPLKVLEKIFQPFFTTKPMGEGTGLGLSLSYDITTKGHGGTIDVNTREGQYTELNTRYPFPAIQ
jgi:two-component system, NtrC family, sensor kinase